MSKKRVMIAEDDYVISNMFKRAIEDLGGDVVAVTHTYKDTVDKAQILTPDLILLDISMDRRTAGIDACGAIKKTFPGIKIYFLSAYAKEAFEEYLSGIPYDGYIDKINFQDAAKELLVSESIPKLK